MYTLLLITMNSILASTSSLEPVLNPKCFHTFNQIPGSSKNLMYGPRISVGPT
uniref:Uncharacterized protein n=1 Tax=Rhizophora mucronata TaxID=61149 RepID=A0A2P2PEB0_RHIMU